MSNLFISCGEASGDQLAASLINALKQTNTDLSITAMAGEKTRQTGVELLLDSQAISVVGITEILTHLGGIYQALKTVKNYLKTHRPDLVILIDAPGFNFRIAKYAKKLGLKVLYYVSPQIWAWRSGRIKTLKKTVDHMAVLFSFEKSLYDQAGIPATFVGHPLVDDIQITDTKPHLLQRFGLHENQPVFGLFPGSRHHEIERLLPTLIDASNIIKKRIPEAQFIVPVAHSFKLADIREKVPAEFHLVQNELANVVSVCDVALAVSGTVTLEIAYQQVPLTLFYKMSALTFKIAQCLVKTPFAGLCNIVAEKCVAKEFIQHDATANHLAQEAIRLLQDHAYRQQRLADLNIVKQNLGNGGSSQKIASLVLQLISETREKQVD